VRVWGVRDGAAGKTGREMEGKTSECGSVSLGVR
jgi:hypothetical protein